MMSSSDTGLVNYDPITGTLTSPSAIVRSEINDADVAKMLDKFDTDVIATVKLEKESGRLYEDGRVRLNLRDRIQAIILIAAMQMKAESRTLLLNTFGLKLLHLDEYSLARECFESALIVNDSSKESDRVRSVRTSVDSLQGIAKANYQEFKVSEHCYLTPKSVSKLLDCLVQVRLSMLLVYELSVRQQEESVWQLLNGCKLISMISQPLIWHSCGKYVSSTNLLAATCMEEVINLCTARHVCFRMKLYIGAFYATITQGTSSNASAIVSHVSQQLKELRSREELDPPIPLGIEIKLIEAETDLSIMKCVLNFWKDPASFSLSSTAMTALNFPKPSPGLLKERSINPPLPPDSETCRSITDRCIVECARVQQLTAGDQSEVWKKRSSCLLNASWIEFQKVGLEDFVRTDEEVDNTRGGGGLSISSGDNREKPKQLPIFSVLSLLEMAMMAMFDTTEGNNAPLLEKIFSVVETLSNSEAHAQSELILPSFLQLKLLYDFSKVLEVSKNKAKSRSKRMKASLVFLSSLDAHLHSEAGLRTNSFAHKIVSKLWHTVIYEDLQKALSDVDKRTEDLEVFAPLLLAVARIMQISQGSDSILAASVALTSAKLLTELGDLRSSLTILKQALLSIEEERAARVDVRLHTPEDPRDIFALQQQSISARADAQNWLHAEKRLGAHAFAGYGIFGHSSRADREDQAMAELQTDLTVTYFRTEIQYAITQRRAKAQFKQSESKSSTAVLPTLTDIPDNEILVVMNAENLSCVQALRAYCGKNCYTKCLLSLELARVEGIMDSKLELFQQAKGYIEEAEARESLLRASFDDLTVMKSIGKL
jgi:hypothetical protein